jgi:alpha-L-fucosidase 2
MASLYARAYAADNAVKQLQIFASNFCSPNSFHLNGDQKGGEYSNYTYRPFTLEGNFAFAAGLQEMLLQSYAGFIEIMPAVPKAWKDISFKQLRAQGAFLVDARKENGNIREIKIVAEKGGTSRLKLPFEQWKIVSVKGITAGKAVNGFVEITCKAGGAIVLKNDAE